MLVCMRVCMYVHMQEFRRGPVWDWLGSGDGVGVQKAVLKGGV